MIDLPTIIFFTGATLAVSSFAFKNVFYLRLLTTFSCACTIAYYSLTTGNMYPIMLNALIAAINVTYLLKMRLNTKEWNAIQRYKRIHRRKKEARKAGP